MGEKKKRPPDHFPFRPALRPATTIGVALCVVHAAPTLQPGAPRKHPLLRPRDASFLLLTDSYFDMRDFLRTRGYVNTSVYTITDLKTLCVASWASLKSKAAVLTLLIGLVTLFMFLRLIFSLAGNLGRVKRLCGSLKIWKGYYLNL